MLSLSIQQAEIISHTFLVILLSAQNLGVQSTNWEARWPHLSMVGRSGFELCQKHCVVFLGTKLYSLSATFHPQI